MRPIPQKTVDRKRAVAVKNSAQRKKLIAALVLLAVMGFLWIRLFTGKGKPEAALAVVATNVSAASASASSVGDSVVFVDLPVVPERHNVLANDFFDAKLFKEFSTGDSGAAGEKNDPGSDSQNMSAAAAAVDAMELVAIVNDKKPQAFIEDKLLEEGQSFRFVFHDQNYEFKVVKIHNSKVELECNGAIIIKSIPESSSGLNNKE